MVESKSKAASQFNAYQKKLGLSDKVVNDKYLGTIFTKQQSGFDPELLEKMQRPIIPIKVVDDPSKKLNCLPSDFDPFIKFGRDNQLFVKREYIERLKDCTRYNEDQLKNLKTLYVSYAELGRGLSINSFRKFMTAVFNIENHPFSDDFFLFFDTNRDGLVDFYEMVVGMNIIEKGTFEDKCKFAFTMYDLTESDCLDTLSIREVLRKSYVTQIVALDSAINKIRDHPIKNPTLGWQWDEFETEILPLLESSLPIALDRMEFHKSLINEMEFKYNFTIDQCEHLWNIYRPTLEKEVSENRLKTAAAFAAHSPDLITKEQFKLIMLDVFKVKDAQLVNNLFVISDTNGSGGLDIREIIGNIIFWLRGSLALKFALFFEVFSSVTGLGCVARENLGKVIGDALKVFKESFFQAKTIADKMNTNLNGMVSFEEFRDYCKFNSQAIDFMCRLTIGPYPLSDELQQKLQEYQAAEMQKYYAPMLMQGAGQQEPMMAIQDQRVQAQQQSAGLAAQMAVAHANMVMATDPNNFQIVPLEGGSKKYSSIDQSRMNMGGAGQQQAFSHIRSAPGEPGSQNVNSAALLKRWQPRE